MFLLFVTILVILSVIYIKRKYFTLYGPIPGKAPHFLFGNLLHTDLTRGGYIGDVSRRFQEKYGDTFQIWLGMARLIFVCNPKDAQYVFSHRHIYEQGDMHITQYGLVFNDTIICNIGLYYCKICLRRDYEQT